MTRADATPMEAMLERMWKPRETFTYRFDDQARTAVDLAAFDALDGPRQAQTRSFPLPLPTWPVEHFTPEFEKRSKRSMRRERGKMKGRRP